MIADLLKWSADHDLSVVSYFWSPWHRGPGGRDNAGHLLDPYLRAIEETRPAFVRHHQPQIVDISAGQQASPYTNWILRSWDFDDSDNNRKRELYANPRQAAAQMVDRYWKMANDYEAELKRRGLFFDRSRWYFGAWNEPDAAYMDQLVEGTAELMRLGKERGMRFAVGCASVGNFSKPSENAYGWTKFKVLEDAINAGGHVLQVHEYWQKEGPAAIWTDSTGKQRSDAGNLAWRHRIIPMNVPIVIGEAGANGYLYNRTSSKDDCGWSDSRMGLSASKAAQFVKEHIEGCDERVIGVCQYMLDYHDPNFGTFNVEPLVKEFLTFRTVRPKVANPMATTPPVTEPPVVTVPDGDVWVWPVKPTRFSSFWAVPREVGYARKVATGTETYRAHAGLDIPCAEGTPVGAPMAGGVIHETGVHADYGNYVKVRYTAWQVDVMLNHLSRIDVAVGQKVAKGQKVGLSGTTGNSTGPHLDIEVRCLKPDGVYDSSVPGSIYRGAIDPVQFAWIVNHIPQERRVLLPIVAR